MQDVLALGTRVLRFQSAFITRAGTREKCASIRHTELSPPTGWTPFSACASASSTSTSRSRVSLSLSHSWPFCLPRCSCRRPSCTRRRRGERARPWRRFGKTGMGGYYLGERGRVLEQRKYVALVPRSECQPAFDWWKVKGALLVADVCRHARRRRRRRLLKRPDRSESVCFCFLRHSEKAAHADTAT
jgi:hypothetical protein